MTCPTCDDHGWTKPTIMCPEACPASVMLDSLGRSGRLSPIPKRVIAVLDDADYTIVRRSDVVDIIKAMQASECRVDGPTIGALTRVSNSIEYDLTDQEHRDEDPFPPLITAARYLPTGIRVAIRMPPCAQT